MFRHPPVILCGAGAQTLIDQQVAVVPPLGQVFINDDEPGDKRPVDGVDDASGGVADEPGGVMAEAGREPVPKRCTVPLEAIRDPRQLGVARRGD